MEKAISYWRELYILQSKTEAFKKKTDKARGIIEEFLSIGSKNYVAISGGKDSTAMAHLVSQVDKKLLLVSEKDDMDFPMEEEYLKKISNQCDMNLKVLRPEVSLWDVLKRHDFTEDIHSAHTEFSERYFYSILRNFQLQHKYKGVFLGLRAEESKGRAYNVKVNRYIYYNAKWQQLVCQPLADWKASDVYAYLFQQDLPILPVYFQTKFVNSPEDIRKSWILPSAQSNTGQALWLKHYYPELYAKLCLINSKMRAYV